MTKTFKSRRRRKRSRVQDETEQSTISKTVEKQSLLQQLRNREIIGLPLSFHKKRRIPFRQLKTPLTEAVLGLDAAGDYVIGLEARYECLELVQRAIPSSKGAPLVQRIALPCPGLGEGDSLVATVPIDILLSGDIGIARIQTHQSTDDDDDNVRIGSMVLFNLATSQTSTCSKVRLSGTTIRNLLWKVHQIPVLSCTKGWSCRLAKQTPAHLLLNDEDDGYRLTWIVAHDFDYSRIKPISNTTTLKTKPMMRQDIVVKENTWQGDSGIIAAEAYLSIEALLDDVRARRKEVFFYNQHIPSFYYHLVSVDECGRFVTVVICFSNQAAQKRMLSIAVLVKVDIYTQCYQELEWAQQHGLQADPDRLQSWSEHFALHRRMKDLRIGPFSVSATGGVANTRDLQFLVKDDHNSEEDNKRHDWQEFLLLDRLEQQKQFRKSISMATLYPDCEVLSNAAVRQEMPVQVIKCRSGNTELVYYDQ